MYYSTPLRMAFYRENEEHIQKDYAIETVLETFQTGKSLLEIVKTNLFGEALFLDNELQLTLRDEYIYHESLVHPGMSLSLQPKRVCILGGGDGCAAREVLKWSGVEQIDIVDWDKEVLNLFQDKYCHWNSMSFHSPKVKCFAEDVLKFQPQGTYDIVFVDLVDPDYKDKNSRLLWEPLIQKLPCFVNENGSLVLNVGGMKPWNTVNQEWINMLLANAFKTNTTHKLQAYKCFVPSFATDWCFLLICPIDSHVNPIGLEKSSVLKYFDKHAWFHATNWTRDYKTNLPLEPVKLISYLPSL